LQPRSDPVCLYKKFTEHGNRTLRAWIDPIREFLLQMVHCQKLTMIVLLLHLPNVTPVTVSAEHSAAKIPRYLAWLNNDVERIKAHFTSH
jgi:hypothetical protein